MLIAERFFPRWWSRLKIASQYTAGPEGRSGCRREARFFSWLIFFWQSAQPLGPCGVLRCDFQSCPPHRGKDVQLLSMEVRATQQNPRYSVKNNVAIRMIATFMPKYNEIFNCFLCLYAISSVQQILLIIYCLLSHIRYSCIYLNMG